MPAPEDKIVREFRHMLLWPLQLRRLSRTGRFTHPWEVLAANPGPWKPVKDNLLVDDDSCQLGYREFVYFLPYVQRFLYGFGEADAKTPSSLNIFRRDDIARERVTLRQGAAPLDFGVERLRLIFFYDVDIALLAFEIVAHDLPLEDAVETMDRFGRPYPPSWEEPGQGGALHPPGAALRHRGPARHLLGFRRPREVHFPGARDQADAVVPALGEPAEAAGPRVRGRRCAAVLPDREQAHPDHELPVVRRAAQPDSG